MSSPPVDQTPTDEPAPPTQSDGGGNLQPEAPAEQSLVPSSESPTVKADADPIPKRQAGFSRAQNCTIILLAVFMVTALAALALIVFQNSGLMSPAVLPSLGQATALDAPSTFFLLPSTWTPTLPTSSSIQPGPTVALTSTPGVPPTPLPSLTPISVDRLIVIGRSVQNRPIEVYRFGNGAKKRMIIAGIHGGGEGNTIALADQLIAHLRQTPQAVPHGYTLYILRSLNPDGEVLGNVPEGRPNANGVDLNRNFDVGWEADLKGNGCSSTPGTAGTGPGSEPETQALKEFLRSSQVEVLISYHSAYLGIFPSGDPTHPESARLAEAIHDINNYPYPPVRNGCEYTGTLVDWAASNGVIAAADVELNSDVDTELETNLRVLSLLLSFEPQATPTASKVTPSDTAQSYTATPTIAASPTITPTVKLTVPPTPVFTPNP